MPKPLTNADVTKLIANANAFLKAERTKVTLLRVGGMIYFQGTFPPKPGSSRARPYQQKIASRLPCSRQGIRKARSEAVILGAKLVTGQFDWAEFGDRTRRGQQSAGQWVKKFESDYRAKHTLKEGSWKSGWHQYLNLLDWDAPLTPEALIAACLSKPPDTAIRKLACAKLQALADYAGIEADLTKYQGRYGGASQARRELPTDEEISEWCGGDRIRSPEWRRVTGLIAAYGLRPHEVFLGKLLDDGQFKVADGKTGSRLVRAFYPEWVDTWRLHGELPQLNASKAYAQGKVGGWIRDHLRRTHKIPFKPYDLRHAYAVRVHVTFGLSETVGAKLMGHSPEVHLKIYQRWLGDAIADAAIDRVLARGDRPRPPLLTRG